MQFPFSDLSSEETLSQFAVQLRVLDLFPSPHVALQVDQVPHDENSGGPENIPNRKTKSIFN